MRCWPRSERRDALQRKRTASRSQDGDHHDADLDASQADVARGASHVICRTRQPCGLRRGLFAVALLLVLFRLLLTVPASDGRATLSLPKRVFLCLLCSCSQLALVALASSPHSLVQLRIGPCQTSRRTTRRSTAQKVRPSVSDSLRNDELL